MQQHSETSIRATHPFTGTRSWQDEARAGRGGRQPHLADVLMVATTERMLHGVHRHTTHARPLVALRLQAEHAQAGQSADGGAEEQGNRTLYLWYELPALRSGLSMRPPPAMMPTMARHSLLTVLRAPDGSLMRVLPASGSCTQLQMS